MDIEKILKTLEQHNLLRTSKISGDWYTIYCPFHSDGKERKPSCGVLLHDQYRNGQHYPAGLFHCFACQTSKSLIDAVTYILENNNVSSDTVTWLKENIPGFDVSETLEESNALIPHNIWEQVTNKFAIDYISAKSNTQFNNVSEVELAKYRYTVPYMYTRGLTDELIAKYDIGFDRNHIPPGRKKELPCITFPVRDEKGNTLFLCRRSIEGKYFNYPENVNKPVYGLYELPPDCKSVIICESCINCLTAVKYGYAAVALLGTGTTYQMNQLKMLGVHEFVLCLDGDAAGRRAAQKIKRALECVALIWTMEMPDGKDANDCDKATFDEIYQNRI